MNLAATVVFVMWAAMAVHVLVVSVALLVMRHPRRVSPTPSVRRRPDEPLRTAIGTAVGDDLWDADPWLDFEASERYL